jgi:hypothetical protein
MTALPAPIPLTTETAMERVTYSVVYPDKCRCGHQHRSLDAAKRCLDSTCNRHNTTHADRAIIPGHIAHIERTIHAS